MPRYWPLADTARGFPPDSHWAIRARCDAAVADSEARMQELETLIADRRQALSAARERVEGTVR